MTLNFRRVQVSNDRIETITKRLFSNISGVKYGTVSVSLKVHEGGIVETSYTVSECTKEKEPKRDINPEWGQNYKGLLS
jgi:hypothetical protein